MQFIYYNDNNRDMFRLFRIGTKTAVVTSVGYYAYDPTSCKIKMNQLLSQMKETQMMKQLMAQLPQQLSRSTLLQFHDNSGMSFENVLHILNMQFSDSEKNKLLKLQIDYVTEIKSRDVELLLKQYYSDASRYEALKIIESKLPYMNLKVIKSVLNLTFSDKEKIKILELIETKIVIHQDDDICDILKMFFGDHEKTEALKILLPRTSNPSLCMSLNHVNNEIEFGDLVIGILAFLTFGYIANRFDDDYIIIKDKKYRKSDFVDGVEYIYEDGNEITRISKNVNGSFNISTKINDDIQTVNAGPYKITVHIK